MLDWKYYKNTVKSNILEGFTAFMARNMSITVCLTGNIGKTLSKTMFWKDFLYILELATGIGTWKSLRKHCK